MQSRRLGIRYIIIAVNVQCYITTLITTISDPDHHKINTCIFQCCKIDHSVIFIHIHTHKRSFTAICIILHNRLFIYKTCICIGIFCQIGIDHDPLLGAIRSDHFCFRATLG